MKMKKLSFLIIISIFGLNISAQTVEKTYHFDNPTVSNVMGYDLINFEGCMQSAEAGCPSLPWQSVSLLLPEGTEAASMTIELSDFQELEGEFNLFPRQHDLPYSQAEKFVFTKNGAVYSSKAVYPENNRGNLSTSFKNGYGFAFSAFTPVTYVPATGKVRFARTAKVKINTSTSKSDCSAMLWNTSTVERSVKSLAQNPEMLDSYSMRGKSVGSYDILIITGNNFIDGFDEYIAHYDSIGWRTRISSVEEIYSEMQGRDNQEKIRNYVIQEYQENGISTLIIGGDVNIVPHRDFYCYVSDEYLEEGKHIPADLYYAGLDGTWNDNNNEYWGEIGEDDLLPEIGVARLPFNDASQQNNMIHKTLAYQRTPVLGEFQHVTLGGEWMSDTGPTYGSQYMNMIIGHHDEHGYTTTGIPEDYDFHTVYEENGANIGPDLMAAINLGGQFTHHAGHANYDYVAGWYNNDITDNNFSQVNGVTHNYTFFYSHGCIAGAFDQDCIMERMVTIQNFCVAAIGNSRYGWFSPGSTDGPSMHLHREMVDAQYTDKMPNLALALMEAKTMTAPWVNALIGEQAALRWNYYDLNILGDGAVACWLNEPQPIASNYQATLKIGTSSTMVVLTNQMEGTLNGFSCRIFAENQLLGSAFTDETGVAEINFDEPLTYNGDLRLVITGQNSWPQISTIHTQMYETPYVIYNSHSTNTDDGIVDFADSLTFNVVVRNYGAADAQNIVATLSSDDEYVEILNPTVNIESIASLESYEILNTFNSVVAQNIPDQHVIKFTLECTDGSDIWKSSFSETVNAPDFQTINVEVEDGGDGMLQPGESATLHFRVKNVGHSDVENVNFSIYNMHPGIENGEGDFHFDGIAAGEEFVADYDVTLSPDIEEGVNYELITCAYFGQYYFYGNYGIAVGHHVEGFETGDFSSCEWQNDEDNPWTVVAEQAAEGLYCAKSAAIGNNQRSALAIEVDVFNNDQIVFYKKVSSEQGYDKLIFYIDDEMMGEWSGNIGWSRTAYDIGYGHHVLRWMYSKDGATVSGQDCAWLDNITLPPTTTITSVSSSVEDDIEIYPNPNNGKFTLNLLENQNVVRIFNSLGQVVYENVNATATENIDISDMSAGIYLININGKTQKLIIQK